MMFEDSRNRIEAFWKAESGSTLKAAALKAFFNADSGMEHQNENRADVSL